MDSEYLKQNVGTALSKAIASCAIHHPEDPVEYVAQWLIQYVNNVKRQQELSDYGVKLQEERKTHEQSLEFERLRIEEGIRVAEENRIKKLEQEENNRKELLSKYNDSKQRIDDVIIEKTTKFIEEEKAKGKKNPKVDPLLPQKERLSHFTELISKSPKDKISKLLSLEKEPNPIIVQLIHSLLYLFGYRKSEVSKWRRVLRILKKIDVQQNIVEMMPTQKQQLRKFLLSQGLFKKINVDELIELKQDIEYLYFYDWLKSVFELRAEAIKVRNEKLGIEYKEETIDPDTLTNDEDDIEDEEEQEELEIPIEESEEEIEEESEEVEESEEDKGSEEQEQSEDNEGEDGEQEEEEDE